MLLYILISICCLISFSNLVFTIFLSNSIFRIFIPKNIGKNPRIRADDSGLVDVGPSLTYDIRFREAPKK